MWPHSAIRCLGALVWLLFSQFDCPLIEEFLGGEKPINHMALYFVSGFVPDRTLGKLDFVLHTLSLVMSRSPTEYLSQLIYVLTVYRALWNCLSISVSSSKTLLADHSNTYGKINNQCLGFGVTFLCFLLFGTAGKSRRGKRTVVIYFQIQSWENSTGQMDFVVVLFHLASPGLNIPHVGSVCLEKDHGSKVHIFVEEL